VIVLPLALRKKRNCRFEQHLRSAMGKRKGKKMAQPRPRVQAGRQGEKRKKEAASSPASPAKEKKKGKGRSCFFPLERGEQSSSLLRALRKKEEPDDESFLMFFRGKGRRGRGGRPLNPYEQERKGKKKDTRPLFPSTIAQTTEKSKGERRQRSSLPAAVGKEKKKERNDRKNRHFSIPRSAEKKGKRGEINHIACPELGGGEKRKKEKKGYSSAHLTYRHHRGCQEERREKR